MAQSAAAKARRNSQQFTACHAAEAPTFEPLQMKKPATGCSDHGPVCYPLPPSSATD